MVYESAVGFNGFQKKKMIMLKEMNSRYSRINIGRDLKQNERNIALFSSELQFIFRLSVHVNSTFKLNESIYLLFTLPENICRISVYHRCLTRIDFIRFQ